MSNLSNTALLGWAGLGCGAQFIVYRLECAAVRRRRRRRPGGSSRGKVTTDTMLAALTSPASSQCQQPDNWCHYEYSESHHYSFPAQYSEDQRKLLLVETTWDKQEASWGVDNFSVVCNSGCFIWTLLSSFSQFTVHTPKKSHSRLYWPGLRGSRSVNSRQLMSLSS